MKSLGEFSCKNIYVHERLTNYISYAEHVMTSIFNTLRQFHCGEDTIERINTYSELYPLLIKTFREWLIKYAMPNQRHLSRNIYENRILYNLERERDYLKAIIDFMAGMTDNFAIRVFDELTTF